MSACWKSRLCDGARPRDRLNGGVGATETGRAVRARLLAAPAVTPIPAPGFELFVCRDFLAEEDRAALIRRIDADRAPSMIVGQHPDPEYRTSETCNLDRHSPLARRVEAKIVALAGHRPCARRDDPGAALRGGPAVQGASRLFQRWKAGLGGAGADRRPANLDCDDLPQCA
jgi:hypothetical protein